MFLKHLKIKTLDDVRYVAYAVMCVKMVVHYYIVFSIKFHHQIYITPMP